MRDLSSCLQDYAPAMLEAIAEGWGLAVRSAEIELEHEKLAVVDVLAQRMLLPDAAGAVVAGLTERERKALEEVTLHGVVPARPWTREYGAIERMGGARLERLKPWRSPSSPAERLWYLGLVYRDYGVVGTYRGEVYFVPPDLLKLLPRPTPRETSFSLEPIAAPTEATSAGAAITRDMMALLSYARGHDIRARDEAYLRPKDEAALAQRLELDGASYLAFLQHLARSAGFLRRRDGLLKPSMAAKEWLQASSVSRMPLLFETWLDDPTWDELRQVASLHVQNAGQRRDPREARQHALALVSRCPRGMWFGVGAFAEAVQRSQPDFLRPDADYDTWYIQDARTGAYLTGFSSWLLVEGALLAHLIQGPLYWLGMISLAKEAGGRDAFTLTELGGALLGGLDGEVALAPKAESPLAVRDDLSVCVAEDANLYDRYQLERLADLVSQEARGAVYRISDRSIWRSLEEGIEVGQIIGFLRRASGGRLPAGAAKAIESWASRFGRIKLSNAILLQTKDDATMAELRAHPEVRSYLGQALSARVSLVDEQKVKELVGALKRLKYWPRIEDLD